MAFSLDTDLRAHLDNHLASLVSAYVENKLKRFGLYRRTTIHTGITVAQRTFGDKIKCIDTLLRESGKLLVSKLPITAMSRDETYEIHLKDILITEWCNYGILVVDNGGTRHKEYYISAFLSVADVRTSIQKTYHKSRLEMYEELQNAVKIMPCKFLKIPYVSPKYSNGTNSQIILTFSAAANGRRLCCSRSDREELFRLNCFADHMNFMKDLFCLESGLDPRSYKKNEGNHLYLFPSTCFCFCLQIIEYPRELYYVFWLHLQTVTTIDLAACTLQYSTLRSYSTSARHCSLLSYLLPILLFYSAQQIDHLRFLRRTFIFPTRSTYRWSLSFRPCLQSSRHSIRCFSRWLWLLTPLNVKPTVDTTSSSHTCSTSLHGQRHTAHGSIWWCP